jgi:hypothetical protein
VLFLNVNALMYARTVTGFTVALPSATGEEQQSLRQLLVVIEEVRFAVYRTRGGIQLELLENPSNALSLFVPEPSVAPNGFVRKIKGGKP